MEVGLNACALTSALPLVTYRTCRSRFMHWQTLSSERKCLGSYGYLAASHSWRVVS